MWSYSLRTDENWLLLRSDNKSYFCLESCGLVRVGVQFGSDSIWKVFFTQVTSTGVQAVDSCGTSGGCELPRTSCLLTSAQSERKNIYTFFHIILIVPDSSVSLFLRRPVILKVLRLLSHPCLGLPLNLNGYFGWHRFLVPSLRVVIRWWRHWRHYSIL